MRAPSRDRPMGVEDAGEGGASLCIVGSLLFFCFFLMGRDDAIFQKFVS